MSTFSSPTVTDQSNIVFQNCSTLFEG